MCWSAEVSLRTFGFAVLGSLLALSHGHPARNVTFLMAFSSIQFAEYLIWKNLDTDFNITASQLTGLLLVIQPLAAINMIADLKTRKMWFMAYGVFLAYALPRHLASDVPWKTTVAANGHLKWNWMPRDAATHIGWIFFLLGSLWAAKSYEGSIFALATLLVSMYYYIHDGTYGSMWCSLSTFAWVFIIARVTAG